jgi:ATP synthase proteolipid subunit
LGSAYGTAKAGVGVAHLGIIKPGNLMKGTIACIMAGVLGIYGLIVSVIIGGTSLFSFSFKLLKSTLKLDIHHIKVTLIWLLVCLQVYLLWLLECPLELLVTQELELTVNKTKFTLFYF